MLSNVRFHKNPYPPHGRSLEILRGGGEVVRGSKAKILKESMKLNWKFQGVGGLKPKNLPWGGGVDILCALTNLHCKFITTLLK